ncbi:MAG TPA: hypothetical protein PK331_16665 [Gordonia sp. (in: high G+C Gram-positive bacteria)]|uniref:hypothetical protein n=1 Tax=Mycobacteriales TaxID=85007 RepID=UPI002456747C|nr:MULTISPECIES: hypothetical protein [Mycobacteriales]HNP58622.1 hypothetical protein [Gordonia sp. (in: high G+C Gram-positive bacteria)]HRC52543.1 hypothetical protein [Gordonia sp. (in: high G+C Gram-positive bacteria)]
MLTPVEHVECEDLRPLVQVAKAAGVPAYAVRRMVYRGELPAVRRGPRGHWQLPLSVVERLRELYTLQANEAFVAIA